MLPVFRLLLIKRAWKRNYKVLVVYKVCQGNNQNERCNWFENIRCSKNELSRDDTLLCRWTYVQAPALQWRIYAHVCTVVRYPNRCCKQVFIRGTIIYKCTRPIIHRSAITASVCCSHGQLIADWPRFWYRFSKLERNNRNKIKFMDIHLHIKLYYI